MAAVNTHRDADVLVIAIDSPPVNALSLAVPSTMLSTADEVIE